MDSRSPRYVCDSMDVSWGDYFDEPPYHHPEYRSRSPFEAWKTNTNLQVALANSSLRVPSPTAQLHPMMTPSGRYPPQFRLPMRFQDLLEATTATLDRILAAYELDMRGRSRRRGSSVRRGFSGEEWGEGKLAERAGKMVALLEFLGAHELVVGLEREGHGVGRSGQRVLMG
ncbi:hypothetical protein MBLNU230_g1973t1 [Neophaeotheca triangularis]